MRRLTPTVAAGAALILSTGCGGLAAGSQAGAAAPDDGWRAIADSPLGPRGHAVAVSLGDRVLVVGGSDAPPCPPDADCALPEEPPLRDGAIYDSTTNAWTSIADAPIPIADPPLTGGVVPEVIGDVAYFLVTSRELDGSPTLLAYDVAADSWADLPPPPVPGHIVATGDQLVVFAPSHKSHSAPHDRPAEPLPPDVAFDPATESWVELPADPLRPSYDRKAVATDAGLVLLAKDLVPVPGADPPLVRAAVLTTPGDLTAGQWSTLPGGEILWTDGFSWTGGLLVNPDQSSADGGETGNWGQAYPGGGILDPKTGTWSSLPDLPADPNASPGKLTIRLFVSGSRTAVYGSWALDVPGRQWFAVPERAVSGDGEPVDVPQTAQASAWVQAPSGGAAFLWGGARWDGWGAGGGDSPGELTSEGFLWTVPSG